MRIVILANFHRHYFSTYRNIKSTIGLRKLIFNLSSSILTLFEPHGFRRSEPSWPQIKWPIFQKLPGTSTSNIDFLTADVI